MDLCHEYPCKKKNNSTEAVAVAKAMAYNKNWNILVFPNEDDAAGNTLKKEQTTPEALKNLFGPDDDPNIAVAVAEGKAFIFNKNINAVLFASPGSSVGD